MTRAEANSNQAFDISIRMNWKPRPAYREEIWLTIAKAKSVVLEIDGVTQDIHPKDHVQYKTNLFTKLLRNSSLKLVALLNYPRPQDKCLFVDKFELQFGLPSSQSAFDWVILSDELSRSIPEKSTASDYTGAVRVLRLALAKKVLSELTKIGIHGETWSGVLDLDDCAFVAIESSNMVCPQGVLSSASLQSVTQDIVDAELDQVLYHMVRTGTQLQELNISTHDAICSTKRNRSSSYGSRDLIHFKLLCLIVLRIHVVELLSRQSSAVKGKATQKIKQAPSPKGTHRISLPILSCCIGTSSCLIMQLRFCTWPRICTLQSWSHSLSTFQNCFEMA